MLPINLKSIENKRFTIKMELDLAAINPFIELFDEKKTGN